MVSEDFISFFDKQEQQGCLYISSISFWEVALLVKRGRIAISDVHFWKNEILENTNIHLTDPSASAMIDSVLLPDIHKDPFDRMLIAQSISQEMPIMTCDSKFKLYDCELL